MKKISVSTLLFFTTVLAVLLIFMVLNENQWNLGWFQIPVSLAIGFLIGTALTKKKQKKIWF